MASKPLKTQTAFRFNKALLEQIKEKAKAENRSLNNYIEYLLYKDLGATPNEDTIEATNETRVNHNLEPISNLST